VTALTETNDGIRVDAGADGTVSVTASDVALAAGRTPNTDGLQLEDIGASLDENGFVETDDSFRTTADGVYAIGDVSGPPMFTHSARDDADLLYRHLAKSEEISTKGRTVPWAVFTDPQIGHVGLTEQEAREAGYEVGVGRQDFADQGKPKALGETEGFVKLVTNAETDELLGSTSSANRAPRSSTNSSSPSNSGRLPTTSRTRCTSTRRCRKASTPRGGVHEPREGASAVE